MSLGFHGLIRRGARENTGQDREIQGLPRPKIPNQALSTEAVHKSVEKDVAEQIEPLAVRHFRSFDQKTRKATLFIYFRLLQGY
jgi:hypothetical protein